MFYLWLSLIIVGLFLGERMVYLSFVGYMKLALIFNIERTIAIAPGNNVMVNNESMKCTVMWLWKMSHSFCLVTTVNNLVYSILLLICCSHAIEMLARCIINQWKVTHIGKSLDIYMYVYVTYSSIIYCSIWSHRNWPRCKLGAT